MMNIRTIEDNFDYQAHEIFKEMIDDYVDEIAVGHFSGTFAEYLWQNRKELGERFYERFDQYAGIDQETEKYNIPASVSS